MTLGGGGSVEGETRGASRLRGRRGRGRRTGGEGERGDTLKA